MSQDIRAGLPRAVIVLSMVGKNYRLTQDMKDAAAALNLPLASRAMILRQIYADAPGQGAVVWNMGSRAREAADEVDQIFREILPDAAKRRSPASHHRNRPGRTCMADRRPLTEGLKSSPPAVDPKLEQSFVYGAKAPNAPSPTSAIPSPFSRVPISTRIRAEFAEALKRASLQRQLEKIEPNTLQDILEEAIEPWLQKNGYLR